MLISCQFVALLHRVASQFRNLSFALSAQHVTNARHQGHHHSIQQVVPAHVEISRLRCHAQLQQLFAQGSIGLSAFGKHPLQAVDLLIHAPFQGLQHLLGVVDVDKSQFHHTRKVGE